MVNFLFELRFFRFIYEFFFWLGRQNDYLYPPDNESKGFYPFNKPHIWKTRFGFITSWNLAKIISQHRWNNNENDD